MLEVHINDSVTTFIERIRGDCYSGAIECSLFRVPRRVEYRLWHYLVTNVTVNGFPKTTIRYQLTAFSTPHLALHLAQHLLWPARPELKLKCMPSREDIRNTVGAVFPEVRMCTGADLGHKAVEEPPLFRHHHRKHSMLIPVQVIECLGGCNRPSTRRDCPYAGQAASHPLVSALPYKEGSKLA